MARPSALDVPSDAEEVDDATSAASPDAWSGRLQGLRDRLAQARGWRIWLEESPERRPVDVAKREGLSRARVCQITRLLGLAPEIIWDLERADRAGPVPSEKQLRALALIPDPFEQGRRYKALVAAAMPAEPVMQTAEVSVPIEPRPEQPQPASVHLRGFQHLFERARRYQELIDGDHVRSVTDVAHLEGVSPTRVSQIMHLLHLAPPIVAILDVPEALAPPVTHKEILGIARMKSRSQQIRAFWGLVSAVPSWGEGMAAK